MPNRGEYALFGANAYEGPQEALKQDLPSHWKQLKLPVNSACLDNPRTGFRAHLYHNETTKEVVIAFGGTHMTDVGDLSADVAIYNGELPRQYNDALAVYENVVDNMKSRNIQAQISFTGHSLGGALAQYIAIAAQGCHAATFGSPGILDALGILRGKYNPGYSYPVVNHVALGDMFGMYGRHLGITEYYALDMADFIMSSALPFVMRRIIVGSMLTYHSHSVARYRHAFQPGGSLKPTGKVTNKDGKRYEIFKRFNWSGVAKDEYI